jgi:hypothetical protein
VCHWLNGGLTPGADGRWTWRYDPAFRMPGPPERQKAVQPLVDARFAQVTCPGAATARLDRTRRAE